MIKVNKTVKKETLYVSAWVLIFSVLMQAVFLIIGAWDYTVLLGNLLGDTAAILNFFFLGITVQNVSGKEKEKIANTLRFSQLIRLLGVAAFIIVGVVLPYFNMWAVIISAVLFARIGIALRPIFEKKTSKSNNSNVDDEIADENKEV